MSHAGDLLAELLAGYGTTHVFGLPGGQTAALYDGIAHRSPRIEHVLVRDERTAAYAADAFARLTGRPGVCDVTVGPGTTKLADGLVESLNASVPVVAVVGELPRDWAPYREKGVASQGFDQVTFLASIGKSVLPVPSLAAFPQMVRSAFRIATTGRPGPVSLVVPHDVLDAEWEPNDADTAVDDRYRTAPAYRPVASAGALRDAAALLAGSRRPFIVAGGGVLGSRATEQVAALAERLDAVVATSFSGKGAVAETAAYATGVLNPLGTTASLELAKRADVVLWCGTKLGQNTSHNWTLPLEVQATIHLDMDGAELGRTFRPSVALNGDARATLDALLELLGQQRRPEWRSEARAAIDASASERREEEASDATPVLPQRAVAELARRLPDSAVVISDASFSAGWVAAYLPARRGGRDFLFARGQGGLGYAVPAAIGAAAARPGDRIVTVSGDGGFAYAVGELMTHAQRGIPSVNVVLNNGSLGWLRMWQHLFFGGLRTSVDLRTGQTVPSLAGAAESLGCRSITVEGPDQLGDAMDAAFSSDAPVVIDVRVDEDATPIHGYRRRLAEGTGHARPGTVYRLPPWRASPATPAD